jgi:hypothetical protein
MERLQITTLAAQNITSPLLVATYTAGADKEILVNVCLSGLSGNGTYRACLTKQMAGAGSHYQSPTAAMALTPGVTTVYLLTTPMAVKSTDVVKVYVQGLAADSSVSVSTEVFDVTSLLSQDVRDAMLLAPTPPGTAIADSIDAHLDAILDDTGTSGVVLTSAERNSIAAALLDLANGVEAGFTPRQILRGIAAVLLGKSTQNGNTFAAVDDSKNRITGTVDANNNRTAVTRDLT